jgi:hypothetical protein
MMGRLETTAWLATPAASVNGVHYWNAALHASGRENE